MTFESSGRFTVEGMDTMRISQLAERSGVPATTLRFYEAAGLIACERTAAGYRIYRQDAIERLAFIGAAEHLGLTLEEIAELLAIWQSGPCAQVKADLQPRIAAHMSEAEQRAAHLAGFIDSLRQALHHLDQLPDRAEPCGPECGFPPTHPTAAEPAILTIQARPNEQDAERRRTAPVACSLTPEGFSARTDAWRTLIAGATREQTPDGLRLTLPADRAATVAELAAAEQACCPFFDFHLHFDGPELHLEVRAPADAGQLLADLFDPAAT